MKKILLHSITGIALASSLIACTGNGSNSTENTVQVSDTTQVNTSDARVRPEIYTTFTLSTDLSSYSEDDKKMLSKLIQAAKVMDTLFWMQSYGTPEPFLSEIKDERARTFATYNYGPYDRLADNTPFIDGIATKALGAEFYPKDMTKDEFKAWEDPKKGSPYTLIKRDDTGKLMSVAYSEHYKPWLERASMLLKEASELSKNIAFKKYLEERSKALLTDSYDASDIAWLKMKDNPFDIIIGPIENYEDHLFGYKTAYTSYVLVKDMAWSKKLERFTSLLPKLQAGLPVEAKYKKSLPGSNSQLNAYDIVYYAGDCNSGSKTIAVNLPNDEKIQDQYGTRRSQLKNAMQAKFEKIMLPISEVLIAEDQRKHITFNAFFENTMFHEVAHGLGVKELVNGEKGTIREKMQDMGSSLEEGKADILGLYMVTELRKMGEITEGELMDNYVTFMAGIFRSVRFGASSAHGKANMVRFNFFSENGAFTRDENGMYKVNAEKMAEAVNALSEKILVLQGNGDYEGARKMTDEMGLISPELQSDLEKLSKKSIPVDVVFEQGIEVLGLE